MHTDAVQSLPGSPKQSSWLSPSCSSTPHLAPRQARWHHSETPLVWLGSVSPSQGQGEALQLLRFCSRDECSRSCFSIIPPPVAVSASSLSVPLHHPLAVQSRSPNGCSGLVHACSTWSLCCPIAKLVLLSRNTAVRGTPGLPDALSFLGKGRKQILPVGKS